MKYMLLSVGKNRKVRKINIGDYIQALASSQYLPQIDGFLDRDEDLKNYDDEPCKVIMNGWYMHNPENWPPSEKIIPFFVAFHLNVLVKEELTSENSIRYFKLHEPIGCRDNKTVEILRENNIKAYFSGCMTLTLGKKYYTKERENKTYIVDPSFKIQLNYGLAIKALLHFIQYPIDVTKLVKIKELSFLNGVNLLKKYLRAALYHKEYSRIFSRDIIMNSIYVSHESESYAMNFSTEMDRLREAERLVMQYAKAKLVITSRIHCALPCLGLDTPVIYIKQKQDLETSVCRLDGLIELFNVIEIKDGQLKPSFKIDLPISKSNRPNNKSSWRILAHRLDKLCSSFVS